MNNLKQFYTFTTSQKAGLLMLFGIIIVLQSIYYFVDFSIVEVKKPGKQQWLSLANELDTLSSGNQSYVYEIKPFNPNFISDYKGYKLGMTTIQIDRLFAFRKTGKFANSPKEFQAVTGISDSLLHTMVKYFKFPDWVNNKNPENSYNHSYQDFEKKKFENKKNIVQKDINLASKDDLMKIYGIGDAISDRILKEKLAFGSFVSMQQLNDVWGLTPEVIEKLNENFKIENINNIVKIDINNLSIKELSLFVYFKYPLAKEIVRYRSMNGDFKNIDELSQINNFPKEKAKIIDYYIKY